MDDDYFYCCSLLTFKSMLARKGKRKKTHILVEPQDKPKLCDILRHHVRLVNLIQIENIFFYCTPELQDGPQPTE